MDYNAVNLELLRMAKELVINEYTDRRAEQHNQWLVESDYLWRNQRLRVAYPTIPPYPTEHEILERAKVLMDFVNVKSQPSELIVEMEQITEPVNEPVQSEGPLITPPQELTQPEPAPPLPEVILESEPEQPIGRVLPGVLQKLDQMRKGLF